MVNFNLVPLLAAFAVTFILTPIVRKVALSLKVLDHPDKRKIHKNPMPLLGSIAVYLGIMIGLSISGFGFSLHGDILIILLIGTFLLIVGILDDWRLFHPQIKLLIAMPIAGLILILSDLHLKIFSINFLNYFFTVLWVIGITAAYNLIDGMDGLSTGVCIIASLFYLIIGIVTGDFLLISISSSLMGACFGFLIYNFYPAKIFLGDSGAIFLGFIMASLGLRVANTDSLPILTRWMIPILILVVPILDTSLITFSRLRRRLIPFLTAGNDHVHHRLYNLGLGQRKTVLIIYLLGVIGGFLSLIIYNLSSLVACLVFIFLILIGFSLLFLFEKLPYERQEFVEGATKN